MKKATQTQSTKSCIKTLRKYLRKRNSYKSSVATVHLGINIRSRLEFDPNLEVIFARDVKGIKGNLRWNNMNRRLEYLSYTVKAASPHKYSGRPKYGNITIKCPVTGHYISHCKLADHLPF